MLILLLTVVRLSRCGIEHLKFFLVADNTRLVSTCGLLELFLQRCALASRFSQVTPRLTKSSRSSSKWMTRRGTDIYPNLE